MFCSGDMLFSVRRVSCTRVYILGIAELLLKMMSSNNQQKHTQKNPGVADSPQVQNRCNTPNVRLCVVTCLRGFYSSEASF